MGISLASGAPVEAGLLTGIIGGIIVGVLSGSSFQVSGPAAGLSILVLEFIQAHGFAALGAVLIVAGAMQIAAGLLRAGSLFRAVSPAVVNGMLSGIGLLIVFSQIYVMLDMAPKGAGLKNITELPSALAMLAQPNSPHLSAAFLGLISVVCILGWKKFAPRSLQLVPAALVAVVVSALVAGYNHSAVHYVNVPSNIATAIHFPNLSSAFDLGFWQILENAFVLALIASAETLLSANAVDRLHNGNRTKYDRELVAQGVGNTLCGFLGGLPMTGVIARSSVNVHAGAKTRISAILHGLWLLAFVSLAPGLIKLIPVSALAALLVVTGIKLIDIKTVRKLWAYGPRLVAIYCATVVGIICTDLLTGVMVGVVLSLAKLLYTMSRLTIRDERDPDSNRITLHLEGAATFLSLPRIADALEQLPANCELHILLDHLDYVDHACLELFMDWEQRHKTSGGMLCIDWGELDAAFRLKTKRRVNAAREALREVPPPVPAKAC
jgi:MFS superfamily sulfate permease-like transporter